MALNAGTGMRGVIVGELGGGGWVANITHPVPISEIEMPREALCLTRSYDSDGSRTRITELACPDMPIKIGNPIAALVETDTVLTGEIETHTIRRVGLENEYKDYVSTPVTELVGFNVVRWGLRTVSKPV